jgi:hypothetical protein
MKLVPWKSRAAGAAAGRRARTPDEVEALIARSQARPRAARPDDGDEEARFINALASAARAMHPPPAFHAQMRQRILASAALPEAGRQPAARLPHYALAAVSAVMIASMAAASLAAWPALGSRWPAPAAQARPPVPPMSIPPIAGATVLHIAATSPSPDRLAFSAILLAPGNRQATDTPTPSAPRP